MSNIADLFPDRLVKSELGEIPEGWAVKPLGECFDLTMRQSPPGSTYNEHGNGLPFFQGRSDFGFRYPENSKFCSAPTCQKGGAKPGHRGGVKVGHLEEGSVSGCVSKQPTT